MQRLRGRQAPEPLLVYSIPYRAKGMKYGVPCKYELFTTISVALLKCAPPIVVNNFRKVAPLVSKQPASADNMSILYTIGVRHSKSRTEIVWKMS